MKRIVAVVLFALMNCVLCFWMYQHMCTDLKEEMLKFYKQGNELLETVNKHMKENDE